MTTEQLVNRMIFGATFVGGFIAFVATSVVVGALSFASVKLGGIFGHYADLLGYYDHGFGKTQTNKDWGETMLLASIGVWFVIWIVVLRRCLRARKHFMWFRVQS